MATATQRLYCFTLALSAYPDDGAFGRLKAAGCDDATFGARDDDAYAGFDREAPTLAEAVLSAVGDVERAGVEGLVIEGVKADDPDELDAGELAFVAYVDALLRARRLASRVSDARGLASRMLVETA